MQVTVPLRMELLPGLSPERIARALRDYYQGEEQIAVHPLGQLPEDGFLAGNGNRCTDKMEIYLTASPDEKQMLLISLFDNLGKGASGSAIQNLNLMMGIPETTGLVLGGDR